MSNNEQPTAVPLLAPLLGRIHEQRPLVHHITNMVVLTSSQSRKTGRDSNGHPLAFLFR